MKVEHHNRTTVVYIAQKLTSQSGDNDSLVHSLTLEILINLRIEIHKLRKGLDNLHSRYFLEYFEIIHRTIPDRYLRKLHGWRRG